MEVIETDEAPEAVGAYSQGWKTGNLIFTSGQIGLSPQSGELVNATFSSEAEQTLKNLLAVVRAGGTTGESILKTTVYLTDLEHYDSLNQQYEQFLQKPLPARSVLEVSNLPANARLEIEAVAECP